MHDVSHETLQAPGESACAPEACESPHVLGAEVCEAHDPANGAAACCGPVLGPDGLPRMDGGGQPCPPPLNWQQVLETFREQSTPWRVERAGRAIAGRSYGEGPPLYFLNGIGGSHELFCLTAYLLRSEFRCVLFDYPAPTCTADPLPAGVTAPIAGYADDLLAIADSQGDDAFSTYATGFGSIVALTALLRAPERVERAVLQSGFARLSLSPAERGMIAVSRWLPGRLRHLPLRRPVQRQTHRLWFPPFDTTRWQFLLNDTGDVPIRRLARRAAGLVGCDLRPALPEIRTPTMIIRGEGEGRLSAAAQEELADGLPHAVREWMPGCGYLPYLTHPHRLVKLIQPFLKQEPIEP